jgi:hypothetical protein
MVDVTVSCWTHLFFDSEGGGIASLEMSLDFQETMCLNIPEDRIPLN